MYLRNLSIALLLFIYSLSCHAENNIKVVFINPGHPVENSTGNFWLNVSRFMQAAADDLNIELITIYAYRNHILMKSLTEEIVSHTPDYIILVNEKDVALNLSKEIVKHNIPIFFLLNSISQNKLKMMPKKVKNLIVGSVVPDNYVVGEKLIYGLVDLYETLPDKKAADKPRSLLALQGDYTTPASLAREQGLKSAVNNITTLSFVDSTVANWSKEEAYLKVKGIIKRKRIDIIWAANDAMAFGAKKAVLESNIDYPIAIGGINWDIGDEHYPVNLSYGGHVALGAISMVMLKDIHDNKLNKNERFQRIDLFESSLSSLNSRFVERLKEGQLGHYDFLKFSRSSIDKLDFTIKNLDSTFSKQKATNH